MSQSKNNRYHRQSLLPEIGEEGQKTLAQASVLCVGAGGLGSPALLYLAAAGVGRIAIADFDMVEESNLHRQVLFNMHDIGKNKAQCAAEHLLALNPDVEIETYPQGLTLDNVEALFRWYDIILDGSDNFETKFLINDAGVKFEKPVIYAAIQKFEGQVSVFDPRKEGSPCYRCLYPEAPREHIETCAQAGVMGAVAGLVGLTQALQALQLIVPHESFKPLVGRLWLLDTKTMESRTLALPKNPLCPVCSKSKTAIKLEYHPMGLCKNSIAEITFDEAHTLSDSLPDALFVDVRERDEWERGHLPDALHLPLSKIASAALEDIKLPKDRLLLIHCQKGARARKAAQILGKIHDTASLRIIMDNLKL